MSDAERTQGKLPQTIELRNTNMAGQNGRLNEMKRILEAQVKAEPRNAEAWRELAQVKMMLGTPAAKGGKS